MTNALNITITPAEERLYFGHVNNGNLCVRCVLVSACLVLVAGICGTLAIFALIFSDQYQHHPCVENNRYLTYLRVYGWISISWTSFFLLILLISLGNTSQETLKSVFGCVTTVVCVVKIAWWIYGTVLYWSYVYNSCSGTSLRDFGFTFFLIECFSLGAL